MRYSISFGVQNVVYTVKKRRRQKHIRFVVHHDGSLVVTAPRMCRHADIVRVLRSHEKWICANVAHRQKNITVDDAVIAHAKCALKPKIMEKLAYFNRHYRFTYNRVDIRNQKTRWGSCGSNGNLHFNCQLLCVRDALIDYVVVHELCHLKEMNHSPRFWDLVAQTMPDYKTLRKELRRVTM